MPRRCIVVRGTTPDGQPYTALVTVDARTVRCSSCGADATFQCDYPVRPRGGRPGTCSRWLCSKCATEVGPDRHYCPPHERASRLPGVK